MEAIHISGMEYSLPRQFDVWLYSRRILLHEQPVKRCTVKSDAQCKASDFPTCCFVHRVTGAIVAVSIAGKID